MFAMVFTRPDISFDHEKLSQFMADRVGRYGHALKEHFHCLRSTVTQKLRHGPQGAY